jgi:outer membrane lipoprotein-sorting protein
VEQVRRLGVRARWAVPGGVVAVVGIVAAATAVASASVPSLPHRTAAQLLAEVGQATSKPLGPFTATVQETANLGLPQLPQLPQAAQPGGTSGLTSGNQSVTIWYRDPQHIRIAEPVQAGESDLRLNGRTLWLWNSNTQTATKVTLPANFSGLPGNGGNGAALPPSPSGPGSASATLTPQAAASQALKALGPSTVVAVQTNADVAGRPAYQLALEPRSSQSLISQVLIAIDASRHIPLRVEVFGRGSAGLVYSVGFTSLTFGAPATSNFTFTPPPGATVKTQAVPGNFKSVLQQSSLGPASLQGLTIGGTAVSSTAMGMSVPGKSGKVPMVPIPKQALASINAKFAASLPASMSKAQRAQAIKTFDQHFKVVAGNNGGGFTQTFTKTGPFQPPRGLASAGTPKVIGTGWLSVVATPANPGLASAVQAFVSSKGPAKSSHGLFGSSSSSVSSASASNSKLTIQGPAGPDLGVLRALLLASTPVHGAWGSGRLLQTKVVSVLVTSKGQILVGAVTPAVLYADVPAAG